MPPITKMGIASIAMIQRSQNYLLIPHNTLTRPPSPLAVVLPTAWRLLTRTALHLGAPSALLAQTKVGDTACQRDIASTLNINDPLCTNPHSSPSSRLSLR